VYRYTSYVRILIRVLCLFVFVACVFLYKLHILLNVSINHV